MSESNLGAMLRTYMAAERYSIRILAPKIGIGPATLHRLCQGKPVDGVTLMRVLNWLMAVKT